MNLIKEIKNLRDEMLSVNWPSQRLSNIITRYESENPPVIAKDDDRLIEEKDRELAELTKKLCQCDA